MANVQVNMTTKRQEWVFRYTPAEMEEAALKLADYHAQRTLWWQAERDKVEEEIKKSTVKITKQQITGGDRLEVVIDKSLGNRLNECQSKIYEHQREEREFRIWASAFQHADMGGAYNLAPDDIAYFHILDPVLAEVLPD